MVNQGFPVAPLLSPWGVNLIFESLLGHFTCVELLRSSGGDNDRNPVKMVSAGVADESY